MHEPVSPRQTGWIHATGQPFLFLARPTRPPLFVGGMPPPALGRTVRYGDRSMPMANDPEQLRPAITTLREPGAAP
jgi:alkanesulfonate monooxygenase SsuD/methylene tetrahydromethanopterin reductase-like flavin-dependent oxidoreductase (luciferase family)